MNRMNRVQTADRQKGHELLLESSLMYVPKLERFKKLNGCQKQYQYLVECP